MIKSFSYTAGWPLGDRPLPLRIAVEPADIRSARILPRALANDPATQERCLNIHRFKVISDSISQFDVLEINKKKKKKKMK